MSSRTCLILTVLFLFSALFTASGAEAQSVDTRARAYVTNQVSGTVSVIDIASGVSVATIPLQLVGEIAAAPDGKKVYVSRDEDVVVVDTVSNTVESTIPVGHLIWNLAVSPDGGRLYALSSDAKALLVIDLASKQVSATVPIGERPIGLVVTPDGSRVYIAHQGIGPNGAHPTATTVVDTATNSVITNIPLGDFESTGITVSPDGHRIYVSNILTGTSTGHVAVIDTATNTLVTTIPTEFSPFGLAVTPDGSKVYVTHSFDNRVSVIATATNAVTGTILVGKAPQEGVAVTPDGSKLLVANILSNNVMIIDVATDTVVSTIEVGEAPHGLVIALVPTPLPVTVPQVNWAGWSGHIGNPVGMVSSWTVPQVDCGVLPQPIQSFIQSRAAIFVGFWGRNLSANGSAWLPQIGTNSQCRVGQPFYSVVYQMFHAGPGGTPIMTDFTVRVRPADQITASVSFNGRDASGRLTFTAALKNTTAQSRGEQSTFSTLLVTSPGVNLDDALWHGGCIVENDDPNTTSPLLINGTGGGLAKFQNPIQFSQCQIMDGTNRFGVGLSTGVTKWEMVRDPSISPSMWIRLAEVNTIPPALSPNSANGNFSVTWKTWR